VTLVEIDVLEEYVASIIRAKRISELGTLAVTSNLLGTANFVPRLLILFILMMEAISSSEMSVLTRPTGRSILEYRILQSPL
jgi:hypothetical protein